MDGAQIQTGLDLVHNHQNVALHRIIDARVHQECALSITGDKSKSRLREAFNIIYANLLANGAKLLEVVWRGMVISTLGLDWLDDGHNSAVLVLVCDFFELGETTVYRGGEIKTTSDCQLFREKDICGQNKPGLFGCVFLDMSCEWVLELREGGNGPIKMWHVELVEGLLMASR
jgi:hypothetical protein